MDCDSHVENGGDFLKFLHLNVAILGWYSDRSLDAIVGQVMSRAVPKYHFVAAVSVLSISSPSLCVCASVD